MASYTLPVNAQYAKTFLQSLSKADLLMLCEKHGINTKGQDREHLAQKLSKYFNKGEISFEMDDIKENNK